MKLNTLACISDLPNPKTASCCYCNFSSLVERPWRLLKLQPEIISSKSRTECQTRNLVLSITSKRKKEREIHVMAVEFVI
jgi:hypothetical protein